MTWNTGLLGSLQGPSVDRVTTSGSERRGWSFFIEGMQEQAPLLCVLSAEPVRGSPLREGLQFGALDWNFLRFWQILDRLLMIGGWEGEGSLYRRDKDPASSPLPRLACAVPSPCS